MDFTVKLSGYFRSIYWKSKLLKLSANEQPWPEEVEDFYWAGTKKVKPTDNEPFGIKNVYAIEVTGIKKAVYIEFYPMEDSELRGLTGRPEFSRELYRQSRAQRKGLFEPVVKSLIEQERKSLD